MNKYLPTLTPKRHIDKNSNSHKSSRGGASPNPGHPPRSASGARAGRSRRRIRRLREKRRGVHPSRASGTDVGAARFQLRAPQAISHFLGSECSTAVGIPNSLRNTSKECSGGASTISCLL
eukprot:15465694-Alexandrium_andersonii.AAC.2